jgi:predicted PurR-regulated permease PerM
MNKDNINRFFIIVFFLILAYLSFMILQGFLMSIFIGAIVAYMVFPVYKRLEKATGSGNASALLLSIAAVSVLIILFGLIILPLVGEFEKFYLVYSSSFPQKLEELGKCSAGSDDLKCQVYTYLSSNVGESALRDAALSIAKPASEYVISNIMEFIKNIPNLLIQFTIILFSTFYFLNSGASSVKKSLKALPLKEAQKTKIKHRIKDVLNAVIYGNLMTSFIEGVIVAGLFFILGIDLAVIAGILIMVFALLPPLGAMIVWLPAVIILVLMKEYVKAVLLFVACFAILGYIDNIARPAIISKRVRLSFLWVLLGVFGGLSTFGFIGILAGPLILSLFVTVLDLASEELIEAQNGEENNQKDIKK